MEMNPEDIKRNWQMLNRRVDALEERTLGLVQDLTRTKSRTLQQRLGRRYRIQALMGFLMPLLAPVLVYCDLPLWVGVLYGFVGIILGLINLRFSRFISRSDYTGMPIVEAMAHAAKVLRWQIRIKRMGYLLVVLIGAPLLYEIWMLGDTDLFVSACSGGVIGGLIGFYKQRVNNRIARQLVNTLENDINQ